MGNDQGVLRQGELPPQGTKLSRLGDYQLGDGKQSARRGSRGDVSALVRGAWWHGSGAEALWGSVASSNLKWTGGVTVIFMGTCVMLFAGRDPSSPLRFAMDVAGEGCHLVLPCGGIHGTPCGAPQEAHLASPRKRNGGSGSAVNSSSSSSIASSGSAEQLELKMRQVELLDVSRGVRLLLRLSTAADAQEWSSHVLEVQRRAATFVQSESWREEPGPENDEDDTWTVVSKQQCSADRGSSGSGDRRASATFETADGGRYSGQTHLLRAHGEGTLALPNDAAAPVLRYDGGFSASTRHGRGTITLRDGQEWECQWHGGAVQAAASGAVHACRAGGWAYAGGCAPSADDAAMPVRRGHGRLRCRGGDTLDATFAAGAVAEASMGVLRYACGALYFGQLRAAAGGGGMQTGVPHGYGELYLQGVHAPSHDKRRPAPPSPRPCGAGSSGGGSGGAAAASGAGCCCENGAAAAALLALGADLLWYKGEFRDGLPDGRGLVNFRDRPRRDAQAADDCTTAAAATATGVRAAAPFCTVGAPASTAGVGGFGGFDDHDEDEDDDHDPSDTPQGPLSPSAGAAPSAAADFKNIRSCDDAHAGGLRLDFEIEMRRGALVRRSSLHLAALKMARAELRRLERAVQQERRSLQMLQAQRHCLVCSAREINALLNAHDARCCHRCLCIACAATARECPLCRTPVDPAKTIQIFST